MNRLLIATAVVALSAGSAYAQAPAPSTPDAAPPAPARRAGWR